MAETANSAAVQDRPSWQRKRRLVLLSAGLLMLCVAGYVVFSYHHLWLARLAYWRGDAAETRRQVMAHFARHPQSAWGQFLWKQSWDLEPPPVDRSAVVAAVQASGGGPPPPTETGPKLGDPAPQITLQTLDGREVRLPEAAGGRPVVLHFGSYSCPLFRGEVDWFGELYNKYRDRVDFYTVYIRENHPFDPDKNEQLPPMFDVRVKDAKTLDERCATAETCRNELQLAMPVLVDGIDDAVGTAYAAQPTRTYVIAPDGSVAFKNSSFGPDHNSEEIEQALAALLEGQSQGETPEELPHNASEDTPADDGAGNAP